MQMLHSMQQIILKKLCFCCKTYKCLWVINKFNQIDVTNAVNGDPVSAYGGILGLNSLLEENVANEIVKSFFEIVVAPKFSNKALGVLQKKKNLRIIQATYSTHNQLHYRSVSGGILAQSQNFDEKYELKPNIPPYADTGSPLTELLKASI